MGTEGDNEVATQHCLSLCPDQNSILGDDFQSEEDSNPPIPTQESSSLLSPHPKMQTQLDQQTQLSAVLKLHPHYLIRLHLGLGWR